MTAESTADSETRAMTAPVATPSAVAGMLEYSLADVGYHGEVVVRAASLRVAAGEVVGLVGPNGAGKQ